MYRVPRLIAVLLFVLALAFVAGCGGGGGVPTNFSSSASVTTPTGAQAQVSAQASGLSSVSVAASASAVTGDDQAVIIGFKRAPGRADDDHLSRVGARVKRRFGLIPAMAADMSRKRMAELSGDANVAFIEPDATAYATADQVPWGMTTVSATKVWPTGDTGAGVKIAVIDTGIDYHHLDLAPRYKGGYNFVAKNTDPLDDNGHGTHTAGIIAATVNGSGVKGVAPEASLYALKVLAANGSGSYSSIIAALDWCVTNHMQIASMSLGADANSTALHNACDAAYQAGVLLVAAAGNSGAIPSGMTTAVNFPARFTSVMAVAAVDQTLAHPYWSSVGPQVEISAPGVSILSDRLGGGLVKMDGTSMACPHVTGVAALLLAKGYASAASVRSRMDKTATDLGAAGRDATFGWGMVNAAKACSSTVVASL